MAYVPREELSAAAQGEGWPEVVDEDRLLCEASPPRLRPRSRLCCCGGGIISSPRFVRSRSSLLSGLVSSPGWIGAIWYLGGEEVGL
jgi:hypothetical protein